MINLEEMLELIKGVKIIYNPSLIRKLYLNPVPEQDLTVNYDPADDMIIGDNLDQGWYKDCN